MSKKTEINEGLAQQIAHAAGFPLYERKSSMSAKANAQLNLSGRTHYVDEGTLRHFASRINSSRETDFGLVFALVESVSGDYQHSTRGFRFVAFDLYGTVINERVSASSETLHRRSEQAEKDMWQFLDSFDVAAHYKTKFAEQAERLITQAAKLKAISKFIKV